MLDPVTKMEEPLLGQWTSFGVAFLDRFHQQEYRSVVTCMLLSCYKDVESDFKLHGQHEVWYSCLPNLLCTFTVEDWETLQSRFSWVSPSLTHARIV